MVDKQPTLAESEVHPAAWHWLLEKCNHEAATINEGEKPSAHVRALVAAALQLGGITVLEPTRGLLNLVRYCLLHETDGLATPSQDYVASYLNAPLVSALGVAVAPRNLEQFARALWIEASEEPITARALAKRVGVDHKTIVRWRKHLDWPRLVGESKSMIEELHWALNPDAPPYDANSRTEAND